METSAGLFRGLPYYLQPMPAYTTLSEAVNDLQRRGYTDDLIFRGHCLVCNALGPSTAKRSSCYNHGA